MRDLQWLFPIELLSDLLCCHKLFVQLMCCCKWKLKFLPEVFFSTIENYKPQINYNERVDKMELSTIQEDVSVDNVWHQMIKDINK